MPRRPKPIDWNREDAGWYASADGQYEIVRESTLRDCRCPSQLCLHEDGGTWVSSWALYGSCLDPEAILLGHSPSLALAKLAAAEHAAASRRPAKL